MVRLVGGIVRFEDQNLPKVTMEYPVRPGLRWMMTSQGRFTKF